MIEGTPITSIASTSSLTRIAPSWATIPPPIFAATMKPKMNGTISRVVQKALKIGAAIPVPSAREIAEPSIPQVAPARNEIQTITSMLPTRDQRRLAQHLAGVVADPPQPARGPRAAKLGVLAGGVDHGHVLGRLDRLRAPRSTVRSACRAALIRRRFASG